MSAADFYVGCDLPRESPSSGAADPTVGRQRRPTTLSADLVSRVLDSAARPARFSTDAARARPRLPAPGPMPSSAGASDDGGLEQAHPEGARRPPAARSRRTPTGCAAADTFHGGAEIVKEGAAVGVRSCPPADSAASDPCEKSRFLGLEQRRASCFPRGHGPTFLARSNSSAVSCRARARRAGALPAARLSSICANDPPRSQFHRAPTWPAPSAFLEPRSRLPPAQKQHSPHHHEKQHAPHHHALQRPQTGLSAADTDVGAGAAPSPRFVDTSGGRVIPSAILDAKPAPCRFRGKAGMAVSWPEPQGHDEPLHP